MAARLALLRFSGPTPAVADPRSGAEGISVSTRSPASVVNAMELHSDEKIPLELNAGDRRRMANPVSPIEFKRGVQKMVVDAYITMNGTSIRVPVDIEIPATNCQAEISYLKDQVTQLKAEMTNVRNGSGMRMNLSFLVDLITFIEKGKKIQAIKTLREATPGLSLREAKDTVERVTKTMNDERSFTIRDPWDE